MLPKTRRSTGDQSDERSKSGYKVTRFPEKKDRFAMFWEGRSLVKKCLEVEFLVRFLGDHH